MTTRRIGAVLGSALLLACVMGDRARANPMTEPLERLQRTVRTVRFDPHGKPAGVILSDGTEYIGNANDALLRVAIPGDPVRIEIGSGDRLVLVNTLTARGATLGPRAEVDLQPFAPPPTAIGGGPQDGTTNQGEVQPAKPLDDAASLGRYAIDGRVDLVLTSPTGAPAGLLLADGTQVHVIPRVADVLMRFKPGDAIRVEGRGTRVGKSVAIWALSISRGRLVYLDLERGRGAPEIGVAGTMP
jgi:hypothetical protein